MLCNLIANAVRYSPAGTEITVAAYGEEEWVRFEVRDHGYGVAPADRERIFEEFVSVPCGGATGGTGLGLALARGLVEMMGGTMHVTGEVGEGSTFSFTLPRCAPPL